MNLKSIFRCLVAVVLSGCASSYQEELYTQKPAHYAYIVGDVEGNSIDVESFADVYATPDSCQKMITALLSLKALGPNYRFMTKLYVTKSQEKLRDVVLTFSGDPTLTSEDLIKLIEPLTGRLIEGKIFLDASLFRTPPFSPNLLRRDVGTASARPVSAIIIDKNVITVSVTPTGIGKPAHLTNDAGYEVDGTIITTSKPSSVQLYEEGGPIHAKGHVNVKDTPLKLRISPQGSDTYILHKMRRVLKEANIGGNLVIVHNKSHRPVQGLFVRGTASKPLRTLIPAPLKISENLTFDSLFLKLLHAHGPQDAAAWDQGDAVIKSLMKRCCGVDLSQGRFVDGSGLARYNRIQPRQLFQVLQSGYHIPELMAAMPSPGEDKSTLKRRRLPRHIKAKDGIMTGITCLCGYRLTPQNPKVFVIMTDSFSPPTSDMTKVIDQFVTDVLGE